MARKQRKDDTGPTLSQLLDPYAATRVPPTIHQAMRAIRCGRCGRTLVYDGRHDPPKVCIWCQWEIERAVRDF